MNDFVLEQPHPHAVADDDGDAENHGHCDNDNLPALHKMFIFYEQRCRAANKF
jgi:hypothetical protein